MITWICISAGATIMYCALIIYYRLHWKETSIVSSENKVKASIIIPVRNEEKNIMFLLRSLLKQEGVKDLMEVIVVDDNSEDNTVALVEKCISANPAIISLYRLNGSSKKQAIERGVEAASGELIITVDGDCLVSPNWLQTYLDAYVQSKPSMMMGRVLLAPAFSFVEQFQQLDYLAMQVCGLASMQAGKPLLCSGANLAFTKSSFIAVNGYQGNREVASGDDVFLMMKMQERFGDVKALIHPDLVVSSLPEITWAAFYSQRKRWGSKLKYYRNVYIKSTGLFLAVFYLLLIVNLLAATFYTPVFYLFLSMITVKFLVDLILLRKGAPIFGVRIKTGFFFLSSLIYPFIFMALTAGALSKGFKWKGRHVAQ